MLLLLLLLLLFEAVASAWPLRSLRRLRCATVETAAQLFRGDLQWWRRKGEGPDGGHALLPAPPSNWRRLVVEVLPLHLLLLLPLHLHLLLQLANVAATGGGWGVPEPFSQRRRRPTLETARTHRKHRRLLLDGTRAMRSGGRRDALPATDADADNPP